MSRITAVALVALLAASGVSTAELPGAVAPPGDALGRPFGPATTPGGPVAAEQEESGDGDPPGIATSAGVTGHVTTYDNRVVGQNPSPVPVSSRIQSSEALGPDDGRHCRFGPPTAEDGYHQAQISTETPQWVLVSSSKAPNPRDARVKGVVEFSILATEDAFTSHYSQDRNIVIRPDSAYEYLMGYPANAALEVEWEKDAMPDWAMPTQGDRVDVVGNLVFDCGHWQPSGSRTEIHPPKVFMTLRRQGVDAAGTDILGNSNAIASTAVPLPGYRLPTKVTRADIFASSDGGDAIKQEQCFGWAVSCPMGEHWYQDLTGQAYFMFIPAPPKPSSDAVLRVDTQDQPLPCASTKDNAQSAVQPTSPNCSTMTRGHLQFIASSSPDGYWAVIDFTSTSGFTVPANHLYGIGQSVQVSWTKQAPSPDRRVRVVFDSYHVDDTVEGWNFRDGEWSISALVGDNLLHLLHGTAGYSSIRMPWDDVSAGSTNSLGQSVQVTLLPGQLLRVYARGIEYDDCVCANDPIGTVEHYFSAAENYGIGSHTERFQEKTSYGGDPIDSDCESENGCGSLTYHIVDDPYPPDDCQAAQDAPDSGTTTVQLLSGVECAGALLTSGDPADGYYVQAATGQLVTVDATPNAGLRVDLCIYKPTDFTNAVQCSTNGGPEHVAIRTDVAGRWFVRISPHVGTTVPSPGEGYFVRAILGSINRPPDTPSLTCGQTAIVGTPFSCAARAYDADNDVLSLVFNWGDGQSTTMNGISSGATATASHTYQSVPSGASASGGPGVSSGGSAQITVTARDSAGAASVVPGTTSVLVVPPNVPPTAPSVTCTPSSFTTGQSTTCLAVASDANGDDITYAFTWGDGAVTTQGPVANTVSQSSTHAYAAAGTKTVSVRVTDSKGATGNAGTTVVTVADPVVAQNDCGTGTDAPGSHAAAALLTPPVSSCAGALPAGDEDWFRFPAQTGQAISVAMVPAANADFDLCLYPPSSSTVTAGCSVLGTGATDRVDLSASETGDWRARIYIYSGTGSYTLSVTVTGTNAPPAMPSLSCSPASLTPGGSVSCTVQATDPNGDYLRYALDWGDGGVTNSPFVPSGASQTLTHPYDRQGSFTITARAFDLDGAPSPSRTFALTVTAGNTRPLMQSVQCQPEPSLTGASATCSFVATDADSSGLTYLVTWGDGQQIRVPTSGYVSPGVSQSAPHTWTSAGTFAMSVVATDNAPNPLSSAPWAAYHGVQAPNETPRMFSLACAPSPAAERENVTCQFYATDDSPGIVYKVSWGDGSPVETAPASGSTLPGRYAAASHAWSVGNTYTITVTPTDTGTPPLTGAAMTTSVTVRPAVGNQVPVMDWVACSPNPVGPGASTTCELKARDDSAGIFYTVAWGDGQQSRVPASGYAFPGYAIQASHAWSTAKTYSVSVSATDDGAPARTSSPFLLGVTVANTNAAPYLQQVTCAPTPSTTGAQVSCTAQATDDSSGVAYRFDWGDGSSDRSPATGFSLPGTNVAALHAWSAVGVYTINVTAVDNDAIPRESAPVPFFHAVQASNNAAPVVLGFNCDPATADALAPVACSFRGSDDSAGVAYTLAWGDGTTTRIPSSGTVPPAAAQTAYHAWTTPGLYTVTVSAVDNGAPPQPGPAVQRNVLVREPCSLFRTGSVSLGLGGVIVPGVSAADEDHVPGSCGYHLFTLSGTLGATLRIQWLGADGALLSEVSGGLFSQVVGPIPQGAVVARIVLVTGAVARYTLQAS